MLRRLSLALMLACGLVAEVPARGTYQEPEAFVHEAFAGRMPASKLLWLTPPMQTEAARILEHPFAQRRVRYWRTGTRSAWVLEVIGKEEPITTGIVIDNNRIEQVRVLIYRESRGDEVRYPQFTAQYRGAKLTPRLELDRTIDNISGASLSVTALTRLARLALYLHTLTEP